MPREQMDIQRVANYLHLDSREVRKLASRGKIPCRKVGGQFIFVKGDVDHWVETRMHGMDKGRLAGIEQGVSAHHGFDQDKMLVCRLIPAAPDGIAVPLAARTREAAIRSLVDLADRADLVYDSRELTANIRKREELCSTVLLPATALPHPRYPLPYDIAASFVVVGLTASGIPFGAPDGRLTRLFFLICCKDDRTHLHVLARLAQMLGDRSLRSQLFLADSPDVMRSLLEQRERAVLKNLDR